MASRPCGEMRAWVWEVMAGEGSAEQPRVQGSERSSHSLLRVRRRGGPGLLPTASFQPRPGKERQGGGPARSSAVGPRPLHGTSPAQRLGWVQRKGCQAWVSDPGTGEVALASPAPSQSPSFCPLML